jgi:hypothetical protein
MAWLVQALAWLGLLVLMIPFLSILPRQCINRFSPLVVDQGVGWLDRLLRILYQSLFPLTLSIDSRKILPRLNSF